MADIQWEEPPAHAIVGPGQQRGKYAEIATALRENPGRWALLPSPTGDRTEKGAAATAQNIRRGKVKGFEDGQKVFETAVDGVKVYVRVKPDVDEAEPAQSEGDDDQSEEEEVDDADVPGGRPLAADIRAWAIETGLSVPDRGRLPREITDAFMKAPENQRHLRAVQHQ